MFYYPTWHLRQKRAGVQFPECVYTVAVRQTTRERADTSKKNKQRQDNYCPLLTVRQIIYLLLYISSSRCFTLCMEHLAKIDPFSG